MGHRYGEGQAKATKPKPRRPSYIPDVEKPKRATPPRIRQELIDQAVTIIKQMHHDTWRRFDKVYAAAPDISDSYSKDQRGPILDPA
jgi:hypothetical protein